MLTSLSTLRAHGLSSGFTISRSTLRKQVRLSGVVPRRFRSSAPEPEDPKTKKAILDRVVDKLNDAIEKHPSETVAVLIASDICSIGLVYGAISVMGINFSPEFALAFAASRPLRRFRLPLDLVFAAGVAKVFPALTKVQLSNLTKAIPNRASTSASLAISNSGIMTKAMDIIKEVINKYGATYMMGSRLASVSVVCALYALINKGVDLMPIFASLGVENVGSTLGGYAAAVVLSSALYPVTLCVTGYVAPVVAMLRKIVTP
ncbi:hypothetical protein PsorP6_004664 [Peronosclerospora sorghi]|uniref:Uncharacterized protein n=1 Tax=Peronosclerospora sorghi TaxID=230839 RepID=A0ACC0VMZ3_9STRA|nr:hypothetical protein PsorP6_004664 [Peronosclerospora sorghi]